MTAQAPTRVRTFPISEIFGPTIQGEGPEAGTPCYFVRLGACDYRCSWCDTMYAVEPSEVRKLPKLSAEQIEERLLGLDGAARWVILSGGNPALHQLGDLVTRLQRKGLKVAMETQGSVWRPYMRNLDRLVISPKPPSSGMVSEKHRDAFREFMNSAFGVRQALKIVVFNWVDYEWAMALHKDYPNLPFFLSAGTPQLEGPRVEDRVLEAVLERFRWLCDEVKLDPRARDVKVGLQMHVLAWGTQRGV